MRSQALLIALLAMNAVVDIDLCHSSYDTKSTTRT